MHLISIVIPVFNVCELLDRAFDSILNQTVGFENLEVIFVDDCSTDNSKELITGYVEKYENVKCFYLNENSGNAGKPRNIGLQNVTSDYIMFLDPDDSFEDNACEVLYNTIKEYNVDLVSSNFYVVQNNIKQAKEWTFVKPNDKIHLNNIKELDVLFHVAPSVWSKIYKKSFIMDNKISFNENFPCEDLLFVYETLLKANGLIFINIPLVNYIKRDYAVSNQKSLTDSPSKRSFVEFLDAYSETYNLLSTFYNEKSEIILNQLYYWSGLLINSDISFLDKMDLIYASKELFNIKKDMYSNSYPLNILYNLIYSGNCFEATKVFNLINSRNNPNLDLIDKNHNVLICFDSFEKENNLLFDSIIRQANILAEKSYNVFLLDISFLTDINYPNNFKELNKDLINFYKENNSINIINIVSFFAKRTNLSNVNHNIFSDEISIKNSYDNNNSIIKKQFYTKDNFEFLQIKKVDQYLEYVLFDEESDCKIILDNISELMDFFIKKFIFNFDKRPYLINESLNDSLFKNNIDLDIVYLINESYFIKKINESASSDIKSDYAPVNIINKWEKLFFTKCIDAKLKQYEHYLEQDIFNKMYLDIGNTNKLIDKNWMNYLNDTNLIKQYDVLNNLIKSQSEEIKSQSEEIKQLVETNSKLISELNTKNNKLINYENKYKSIE